MSNSKKNSTNTMDYWQKYPVGKYSGSKRIDPSKEKEHEIDNEFSKQMWIEDREEILKDPDFKKDIDDQIKGWVDVFVMTGFDKDTFDVIFAGQSHIDMAWKWRYEQTRQKGSITFHKAMYHAKNFPGFSYCASEPILFDWFKEG